MTPVYKLLYDYSLQITGDQEAAKRITDEAIEAGVRVALRTMNGDKGRCVMGISRPKEASQKETN